MAVVAAVFVVVAAAAPVFVAVVRGAHPIQEGKSSSFF